MIRSPLVISKLVSMDQFRRLNGSFGVASPFRSFAWPAAGCASIPLLCMCLRLAGVATLRKSSAGRHQADLVKEPNRRERVKC